ncbi:MAG: hypothetical protein K2F94_09535 [Muribaculaceae bacterium]|nr:hypothetical protein [Muribaculaceae bacterium]MDE6399845.1 hypothetical protein [Muribaculaceae bacterium]MDE6532846.1 hypothetical protein [Muribaculaceae bacterium]MDE6772687.1 hypothetical protein [Muribaculaceae bacterium]
MNKNQKIIIYGGCAALICLVALVVVLIISNANRTNEVNEARAETENLRLANDRLLLTNEFNQLNADFNQYEDQQVYLKNDSLVQKYNEARLKVEGLLTELNQAKQSNAANRKRIKDLENEIATLKGIVKHYLEEIKRLGEENEGLRKEIEVVNQRNQQLASQVTVATTQNEQLTQTVKLAKKLNITGVSLKAYNKKGKVEKNITKARQLGVSFTVSPNNTAAAGMKDFYIRIVSPEGSLLGGGGSFNLDGSTVQCTAHRQIEYANEEVSLSVYWDVNTTLTPGDYTVEVFADGYRLAAKHFTMKK